MRIVWDNQAIRPIESAAFGLLNEGQFPDDRAFLAATTNAFSEAETKEIEERLVHGEWGEWGSELLPPGTKPMLWDLAFHCLDRWRTLPRAKARDPDYFLRCLVEVLGKVGVDLVVPLGDEPPPKAKKPKAEKKEKVAKGSPLSFEHVEIPARPAPESPARVEWLDAASAPGWRIGREPTPNNFGFKQFFVMDPGGKTQAVPLPEDLGQGHIAYSTCDLSPDGQRFLATEFYSELLLEHTLATKETTVLRKRIGSAAYAGPDRLMLAPYAKGPLRLVGRKGAKLTEVAQLPIARSFYAFWWTHAGAVYACRGSRWLLVLGVHGDEIAVLGEAAYPVKGMPRTVSAARAGHIDLEFESGRKGSGEITWYTLRGIEQAYSARFGVALPGVTA